MFKIKEKVYDVKIKDTEESYTRAVEAGASYYLCNAPEDVTDEDVIKTIDGSGLPNWHYLTMKKSDIEKYEVK